MKKILFAAFAASLLAAGCQKTEVYQPNTTGLEMTFSTEMKKITKVGTSNANATEKDDNLKAQGFNIWAYADYDLTNATNVKDGIYDGMAGWFVDYNTSWNPNKKYYWPGNGKDLRFFAVSLKTEEKTSGVISSRKPIYEVAVEPGTGQIKGDATDDEKPKITITNFKVDHTAPNEDLMVADFVKQNQNENRKVTLNFHHTLSKVQFLFKTTPDVVKDENGQIISSKIANVTVKSIAVDDLESKGTLEVEREDKTMNSTLVDNDFTWTPGNELKPFGKTSDLGLEETSKVYDTWLMIPQSISGKKINIKYKIDDREFEAIFNLNADIQGFTSWARNQYIKYTIDISPNKIKFNANSSDWDRKTDVDMNN